MDKKIFYLRRCRAAAEEAGRAFDMNPRVILAQGALESGWGPPAWRRSITTISV